MVDRTRLQEDILCPIVHIVMSPMPQNSLSVQIIRGWVCSSQVPQPSCDLGNLARCAGKQEMVVNLSSAMGFRSHLKLLSVQAMFRHDDDDCSIDESIIAAQFEIYTLLDFPSIVK